MSIESIMNNEKKVSFKSFIILILIFSSFLTISLYFMGYLFENEPNECMLILEQEVSCFKGCQYASKITENWTYYDMCSELCSMNYILEFDESGDINSCSYGGL